MLGLGAQELVILGIIGAVMLAIVLNFVLRGRGGD
jgi:hypothetical protein